LLLQFADSQVFEKTFFLCRVIFRWLTAKNLYTIMFDSQLPGSPEALIMAFKDGKTNYAKIFECLAT